MTHQEATYINMIFLVILAILISVVITLLLWLICLIREMRCEIRAQITDSVRLADMRSRDEIQALRAKSSDGPLVHTDDRGP